MEPIIFKYIKNDKTILERYPLEKISKLKKLVHLSIIIIGSVWIQLEIKLY